MEMILKNRYSYALCIISILLTHWAIANSVSAEPGDPGWDQKVKVVIDRFQTEKNGQERERIAAGRAQVDKRLLEMETAYKKGGEEGKTKYKKDRTVRIKDGNRVEVYLVLKLELSTKNYDIAILQKAGCDEIEAISDNSFKANVPIDQISSIALIQDILNITLPTYGVPESYISEGLSIIGAQSYINSGDTGAGIKVAIIDTGFAGISSAISNGDLPSSLTKINCTGSGCISDAFLSETEEHGTAVAEIIYDMARDAQLYLIKVSNEYSLKLAVIHCKNNGIKIINHSVGWFNQNFYDGVCYDNNAVCSAMDANDSEILFVKSAGNSAQKHYYATYSDPARNGWHSTIPTIAANAGDTITIDFTWDAWPTTNQDFDIWLAYYDTAGDFNICAIGGNMQTGSEKPTESVSCYVDQPRTYSVYIIQSGATINPRFHVFSSHIITPAVATSSLTSPADANGVFAVGSINANYWSTGQ